MILSGLMPWEQLLYDRFLKPADRILVVGCGTGRDLIALLKLGYRVEGLDAGARAIALARLMLEREGLSAELYTGPVETAALPGGFDAFIFSWFCYAYIPTADTRIGVLRKLKPCLNREGRILISYVPAAGPPRSLPIRLTRFVARLTGSDWRPELGDVIGPAGADRHAIHYEHQFQEGELESEARAAGLTVVFHERRDVGTAVLTG
jgi:SAM-dependent methyltransferase